MSSLVVHRVTKAAYATTAFSGSRGRGRWHEAGTPMVYASDSTATALLETMVHAGRAALLVTPYVTFEVALDPERHLIRLPEAEWPPGWNGWPWPASTQALGSAWYNSRASVALEVPSAVLPGQRNYLLNPTHPAWAEVVITPPAPLAVDLRLGKP